MKQKKTCFPFKGLSKSFYLTTLESRSPRPCPYGCRSSAPWRRFARRANRDPDWLVWASGAWGASGVSGRRQMNLLVKERHEAKKMQNKQQAHRGLCSSHLFWSFGFEGTAFSEQLDDWYHQLAGGKKKKKQEVFALETRNQSNKPKHNNDLTTHQNKPKRQTKATNQQLFSEAKLCFAKTPRVATLWLCWSSPHQPTWATRNDLRTKQQLMWQLVGCSSRGWVKT